MSKLLTDNGCEVYLVPDPRGESETFEAFSLEAFRNGCRVWTEGIRKDRSAMREEYRKPVDAHLSEVER